MIHISTALKHYKRRDIQEAMIKAAEGREVAVKYGDKGFGKRPDILQYPDDILTFAKNGATSFHVSEERWKNVMQISTDMRRKELDALRKGWDLVIDIDCPLWEYSKHIAHLTIEELKKHDIKSITVKFSGNKGFHIAVPFEAFPLEVNGKPTAQIFPDGVRRIAQYLADRIEPQLIDHVKKHSGLSYVAQQLGITEESLRKKVCASCGKKIAIVKEKAEFVEFVCRICEKREPGNEKFRICHTCNKLMVRLESGKNKHCVYCKNTNLQEQLDLSSLLQIDTVLISSRHLYRMPYSLHEKSGLCSIPLIPENILSFEREYARPENVTVDIDFMSIDKTIYGEAQRLLLQAFDYHPLVDTQLDKTVDEVSKTFEDLQEAIPSNFFPPCISIGFKGLKDGKKRFMFILVNFLSSCGYDYDSIERILDEWNTKNLELLREVLIKGHVRYARQHKKKALPPNCDNRGYYNDMGICHPDGFCSRIKNPVQYAKQKAFIANAYEQTEKRLKLTEEQKDMRRKYRKAVKHAAGL